MKRNLLKHMDLKFLRKTLLKIFFMLIIVAVSSPGFSQQISSSLLCSGGEIFVTANQSLEFAIGEIVTETWHSGANTLTQGFFQGTSEGANSIKEIINNVNVRIYPNPTKSQLTVSCEKKPEHIQIIDLHGREVFSLRNPAQTETLNIKNLKPGIYLLSIVFKENFQTIKQIVKN